MIPLHPAESNLDLWITQSCGINWINEGERTPHYLSPRIHISAWQPMLCSKKNVNERMKAACVPSRPGINMESEL
jgi:hypothetical protein